jgi:hypothetical protein
LFTTFLLLFLCLLHPTGCFVIIHGLAKSHWTDSRSQAPSENAVHYIGEEVLLDTKIYLFGSEDDETLQIHAGTHKYEFTAPLPDSLPSSIDLIYGTVSYHVQAVLDIPWQLSKDIKKPFTVTRVDDLRHYPELRMPRHVEEQSSFYCYCCNVGKLHMTVTLPRGGFARGQAIPILIGYRNDSKVWVTNTDIKLRQVMTFRSQTPWERVRTEEVTLVAITRRGVRDREQADLDLNIESPGNLVASNGRFCRLVRVAYFVRIEAVVDEFHSNVVIEVPVEIGAFVDSGGDDTQGEIERSERDLREYFWGEKLNFKIYLHFCSSIV